MLFTNRNKAVIKSNFKIIINDQVIVNVSETKFLGVWFDENLIWQVHINNICTKLAYYIGVFYRLSRFIPSYIPHLLYNAVVYPHLTYCVLVWGNAANYLINKLFILQRKFIRCIAHAKRLDHTGPLFKIYQCVEST